MAAEPPHVRRGNGNPFGGAGTGQFRPVGREADQPDPGAPVSTPAFGSTVWGYDRREVDAWCAWVAACIAHGRRETVRADSAEATLQAALDRIQELHRAGAEDPGPGSPGPAHPPAADPGTDTPAPGPLPRRTPRGPRRPDLHDAGRPHCESCGRQTTRLDVVQTGVREVLALLHRLVDMETEQPGPAASSSDDQHPSTD